jgi:hypothetical protein
VTGDAPLDRIQQFGAIAVPEQDVVLVGLQQADVLVTRVAPAPGEGEDDRLREQAAGLDLGLPVAGEAAGLAVRCIGKSADRAGAALR